MLPHALKCQKEQKRMKQSMKSVSLYSQPISINSISDAPLFFFFLLSRVLWGMFLWLKRPLPPWSCNELRKLHVPTMGGGDREGRPLINDLRRFCCIVLIVSSAHFYPPTQKFIVPTIFFFVGEECSASFKQRLVLSVWLIR